MDKSSPKEYKPSTMIKVATCGYWNPLHVGHLELLREAKSLGDHLTVIVNNDEQVKLKGSVPFMSVGERAEILKAIKYVDEVVISFDKDRTVEKTLAYIKPHIFAKGGDSNLSNIPESERDLLNRIGCEIVCGVGTNEKIQASSCLIKNSK